MYYFKESSLDNIQCIYQLSYLIENLKELIYKYFYKLLIQVLQIGSQLFVQDSEDESMPKIKF